MARHLSRISAKNSALAATVPHSPVKADVGDRTIFPHHEVLDPCRHNRLLASIDTNSLNELCHHMARMSFRRGDVLLEIGDALTRIWFPESCVVSLAILMENGNSVQVAAIGKEGAIGQEVLLGVSRSLARTTVQLPGDILYVEASKFLAVVEKNPNLRKTVFQSIAAVEGQMMQSAACYALHPTRDRLATLLLMSQDRTGLTRLELTHEQLADTLGVQRTTVTAAALALTNAGYILYRRGRIEICDRPGLEGVACECYLVMNQLFKHPLW